MHVSVLFTAFTAVNTFYLVSRDWFFFSSLGYVGLMVLGLGLLVPVVWLLGKSDYGKGLFSVESSLAVERNPYSFFKFTEKERLIYPVTLETASVVSKLASLLLKKGDVVDSELFSSVKKLDESRVFLEQKMRGSDDVC